MFNLSKTPEVIQAASTGSCRIQALDTSTAGKPELMIMDYIGEDAYGDGMAATTVKSFLDSHRGQQVVTRWNSFGGDAYEGLVMHNAIAEHGNVTAIIDGIAFSAAAIAVSGAKTVIMQEASDFGIHRSWTGAAGNIHKMAAVIEWLTAADEHQISIYTKRTGESREQIIEWLEGTDDGTIFGSRAALEAGFADEVIPIGKRNEEMSFA